VTKREPTAAAPLKGELHTLSVMFIDVAGFSIAAEDQDPASLFADLKAFVATMRRIIRKHGGIVDKVLGDGVLCYFGWRQGGTSPASWHARAAVECAIELQHESVRGCIQDSAAGRTLYPIRIGVNTAPVYVGDLGDEDKKEFTVIGHGVNFAKRIQDSCDVFKVMLSDTTRAALAEGDRDKGIRPRGINIKHHDALFEVYELDPFTGDAALFNQAVRAYQKFYGAERGETRLPFASTQLEVHSDYGPCGIVDVSLNGFQVRLERYLARDVNIRLTFTAKGGDRRNQYLNLIGLSALNCVVRWGRPDAGGYLHGLKILNLSAEQKQIIFSMLSTAQQHKPA
jgi:class 3 adenylate cyclase